MINIRNTVEEDFERILALNTAEVRQTSPMDRERLSFLHQLACYSKVACVDDDVAAFLIAVSSETEFENDNFLWFTERFENFWYVDRIVVDAAFAGRKIGSLLYQDLFSEARLKGVERITCEYNLVPPNAASKAFHNRFGFREKGTQWLAGGTKQVSLQAAKT